MVPPGPGASRRLPDPDLSNPLRNDQGGVYKRPALLLGTFPTVRGLGLDLLASRGRALEGGMVTHSTAQELKNGLKILSQALNRINGNRPHPVKLREWELLKRAAAGEGGYPVLSCRQEDMEGDQDDSMEVGSQLEGNQG